MSRASRLAARPDASVPPPPPLALVEPGTPWTPGMPGAEDEPHAATTSPIARPMATRPRFDFREVTIRQSSAPSGNGQSRQELAEAGPLYTDWQVQSVRRTRSFRQATLAEPMIRPRRRQ